jgi:hypothetical protein
VRGASGEGGGSGEEMEQSVLVDLWEGIGESWFLNKKSVILTIFQNSDSVLRDGMPRQRQDHILIQQSGQMR